MDDKMRSLHKQLPLGLYIGDGKCYKDYSLLRSNGIAEKVYADRPPQKPYTWMGNVLTISIDELAGAKIGGPARKEYSASGGSLAIHPHVKCIALADVSTMLIEIHRTVWQNLIREQSCLCKWCAESMVIDIDLDRIVMHPDAVHKLNLKSEWENIICDLPAGYEFEPLKAFGGGETIGEEYRNVVFNRFIFRNPTLQDALNNEKHAADSITMWRKIALDCLLDVQAVTGDGVVTTSLPENILKMIGSKLFDEYLYGVDLIEIKKSLQDLPCLPFDYEEDCANPQCRRKTPVTIEAANFFSA